jgi:hypothetical protein
MSNNHWGKVHWSGGKDEDVDPIQVMIEQLATLKNRPLRWEKDETMKEATDRRNAELNELEHKINDAIDFKNLKRMGS